MAAENETGAVLRHEDLSIDEIRHVSADSDPGHHLVTKDEPDEGFCGAPCGGLTAFGKPADTIEGAATLGAWVNLNDHVCEECAEVFNQMLFDRVEND